jgi:putative polyhydroxyalkanoate system protein
VKTKSITVNIPHNLTQDQAKARLESGFADLRRKYAGKIADVHETWNGNHMDLNLKVMSQQLAGRLDVEADHVHVEIDLPWMLAMFAEKFRPQVEQEARKMLEKQ